MKYRWFLLLLALLSFLGLQFLHAQDPARTPRAPAAQPAAQAGDADSEPAGGLGRAFSDWIQRLLNDVDEDQDLSDEDRRSVKQALGDAQRSLDRSTDILERAKRSNREALRQAGRQVQLRRALAPNIVLIVADGLGFGELGSYGQTKILTPNLDRLAAEGSRSASYYAGSPLEGISAYTLHTGLHTGHLDVRAAAPLVLRPADCTLAETLWQAGYTTGGVGLWPLGDAGTLGRPLRQGFEYWFGLLNPREIADAYPDFVWRDGVRVAVPQNAENQAGLLLSDLLTADAANYLLRHRAGRPFFLHVAYPLPAAGTPLPGPSPYDDEPWTPEQKHRATAVTRMDRDVGLLLTTLTQAGLDRNTVVLFTSSHGPRPLAGEDPGFFQPTGPLRGGYGSLYEGGLRVPMIVRAPGRIVPASINEQPWASWDLLPTLADLVGAWARPQNIDGVSALPLLLKPLPVERPPLYWEIADAALGQAMRLGPWKGVRPAPGAPIELYDLASDPGETRNVAAKNVDVVARIAELMRAAHAEPVKANVPAKP